jgi:hypothetical protein
MKRALGAIAALALAACGHVETHEVVLRGDAVSALRDPDVYMEGRSPERAFYEVALLQTIGFGTNANTDDVVTALVARGKVIGCDGIVRVRVDLGVARAGGFGVCVRWSPARPAAPPSPPAPSAPPVDAPPPAPSSGSTSL